MGTTTIGLRVIADETASGAQYTRTPAAKRLPTVDSLALALILAGALGHTLWARLLLFLGALVVCVLILHLVFHLPLERLLLYREFDDD